MTWLLCTVFRFHRPPPSVDPRFCISFHCQRCRDVVPGEYASKKKRSA